MHAELIGANFTARSTAVNEMTMGKPCMCAGFTLKRAAKSMPAAKSRWAYAETCTAPANTTRTGQQRSDMSSTESAARNQMICSEAKRTRTRLESAAVCLAIRSSKQKRAMCSKRSVSVSLTSGRSR